MPLLLIAIAGLVLAAVSFLVREFLDTPRFRKSRRDTADAIKRADRQLELLDDCRDSMPLPVYYYYRQQLVRNKEALSSWM